jgi:hypothetical protein
MGIYIGTPQDPITLHFGVDLQSDKCIMTIGNNRWDEQAQAILQDVAIYTSEEALAAGEQPVVPNEFKDILTYPGRIDLPCTTEEYWNYEGNNTALMTTKLATAIYTAQPDWYGKLIPNFNF